MGMGKIGAYYQCYKREEALLFVMENYRSIYTDSDSVLVCDGGNDYSSVAQKYGFVYFHKEKVRTEKNLIFNDLSGITEFILRLKEGINFINAEFFIMLEDDVYVMKKTRLEDLSFDINGCNFQENIGESVIKLIEKYNQGIGNKKFPIGGCGGSILRTSFFKEILEAESLTSDIREYCNLVPKDLWASDRLLTYLCYKNKGTVGNYEGFCETWHNDYNKRNLDGTIEVLHQYKEKY
jgi:hypothetical protein